MEYEIFTSDDEDRLADTIKRYLSKGWVLQGGVSVAFRPMGGTEYAQAMTKPDNSTGE